MSTRETIRCCPRHGWVELTERTERDVCGGNKNGKKKDRTKSGEQKLSDNAQPPLTRSASNRHGHPHKRPRERHTGRLPNNSPGDRGHVFWVWGKLFRVHRQLRQFP